VNVSDWQNFHARWSRLQPPLRANGEVVAAIAAAIDHHRANALLLGVTPELSGIAERTTAVDWDKGMIAHIWPGDTPARRAVLADWREMSFASHRFTAVIGDGSLNSVPYAEWQRVFARLAELLLPGARLAIRVYETPDNCETVAQIRRDAIEGFGGGFHAFKWRLAMALAAERGDAEMPVARIHRAFEREFPDREALSRATGWSLDTIAEIDAYRGLATSYCFPTRSQTLRLMPSAFRNVRFESSGTYELSTACPILVADFSS
jgi:hypothetical protein